MGGGATFLAAAWVSSPSLQAVFAFAPAETTPSAIAAAAQALSAGGATVTEVTLPTRNPPQRTLLRARVPKGWKVIGARTVAGALAVDAQGTADITDLLVTAKVSFQIERVR